MTIAAGSPHPPRSTRQTPGDRAPRNRVLATLDIVSGVLLVVLSIGIGLSVLTSALQYGGLHELCTGGPYEGVTCNPVVLGAVVYGLVAVAILAVFLGFGMFVVSLLRKRAGFYWPLAACILMLVLFYLGTWIAGTTLP